MAGFARFREWMVLLVVWCGVVQAGKLHLTKQFRLATLFAAPNFKGNYFPLEGIYGGCYNVVKDGSVGSMMLYPETGHCEVWALEECGGIGDGKDRPREIAEAVETLNWFGMREGRSKNEVRRMVGGAGVKSIWAWKLQDEGRGMKLQ